MVSIHRRLLFVLALLLGGCAATPPLESAGADLRLRPEDALRRPGSLRGATVIWGGVIVDAANLARETRIEILAYPLDDQRPDTAASPQHRFIAYYPGYLETTDYRSGRLATVRGRLAGLKQGRVGEAGYEFPVVEAERLFLWPEQHHYWDQGPQFHIGIGVLFGG